MQISYLHCLLQNNEILKIRTFTIDDTIDITATLKHIDYGIRLIDPF